MQVDNSLEEIEIINKINTWFKKFSQSPYLNNINFSARFWAHLIIGYFCFDILLEKGLNLKNWDHYAVKKSTQQLMNLEITDNFNEYIPHVLSPFLSFLEENSSLPAKRKLSVIVKDVSPQKLSREKNKEEMKLFEMSEFENNMQLKLKENNKVKQWLKKLEKTARNKIFVESMMNDIFSFVDEIFAEQQNNVQEFFIYSNEEALFYDSNPETKFFEILSDFTLMLDWPLTKEKTITDLYYEQQQGKFKKGEAELLSELRESFLGIYQVKKVNPASYLLEDIFTEEEIKLKGFGLDLSTGKFLICRLVKLDCYYYNVGPTINISQKSKSCIMTKLKRNLPEDDNSDDMSDSIKKYIKNNPVTFLALLNSIDSEGETSETADIFQANFRFQNRKVVYNRLNSVPKIELKKDTENDCDIFYWFKSDPNKIKAIFLLYENHLLVRATVKEILEEAINLIKKQLSFAVILENRKIVNIPLEELVEIDDWEENIRIKTFWETPIDIGIFEEKTPRELIQIEQGREIVIMCLDYLELMNYFDFPQSFLNKDDIVKIRKELGINAGKEEVINDEVERLIISKNSDLPNKEVIIECILLWREYKNQVNKIKGRDKSLAAAVEYLKRSLDFDQVTQREVGNKYGVSANTISQKYNLIAENLNIDIDRGVPVFMPDLDKFLDEF